MPPERQPRTQRIVRVRTGCWSCRRRKKKCDETRPICAGCRRNDLQCEWPLSSSERRISSATHDAQGLFSTDRKSSHAGSGEDLDGMQLPASPMSARHSSCSSSAGLSAVFEEPLAQAPVTVPVPIIEEIVEDIPIASSEAENAIATSQAIGHVLPRTMSMLPGYDPESYGLLSHYLSNTADVMANGTTPINPFLVQIVPLAFSSDLLLQLVIAQSAAHRAFRRGDDSDAVASSHYTKAIQLFRHGVSDFIEGKESNPLMLLVGALLMCFTETAKGDMTGTVFDHLSAAHTLLVKLLEQSDTAVPRELKDFVIEYYVYTATVSMISIDARLSGQLFLNFDLEQRARDILRTQYVGNLCGCWLELLLLIPCIFDLGRQWMMDDAPSTLPTADEMAMFASVQAQILRWSPYSFVEPEVYLAGFVFQQAMLIYLYTSLGGYTYAPDGMYRGLVQTAVTEALSYLEKISPQARINSGLCWPIAVVGSCLEHPEQRDSMRARLTAMAEHFGLGNMQRTQLLLEAMWELSPADAGPWNICRTMQAKQIWISFA
ncbi:Fungal Zn(2)-Cys(6) binuclear cluster domain-containing protein [Penicillium ucsense]|uniref:Fungal Zn(2)-Cys(6) binuclear cluster domain-containing protein n=1 Tax=Penicillium ucsense TaxID=2839758 RepID=A0A8J8WJD2_9EURO|nr:Fungal Zn(2)-Cys(6) binuclear cluster domain-containing protein [Penicillium ucsense]KAF7735154.1 Fungal Zn(2)-Cys(6) binuclear cluster domain-containing protein [Penicillium ucsense]